MQESSAMHAMSVVHFTNLIDLSQRINDYEISTQSKFVSYIEEKSFGSDEWKPKHEDRIYYSRQNQGIPIEFNGLPFIFVGRKVLSCHKGPDLKTTQKKKRSMQKNGMILL
ncbi:uncharacterized protein LOC143024149 [Oratosquilla oratoria]|uniref:uncharacterized protein LOC143024149 n=1 Tax=Oratosquilla oratoria TaxID=337810 RepID=UPI003F761C21